MILDKDLSELPEFFKKLEQNADDIEINLLSIKKYLNLPVTDNRFSEVINIWYNLIWKLPLMVSYVHNDVITRVRQNEEELFTLEEEISYNKNLDVVKAGRFNQPKQSMFYGSLETFDENNNAHHTEVLSAILESCKDIIVPETAFSRYFTVGRWIPINKIPVVNLCYDNLHLSANKGLQRTVNNYIETIKGHSSSACQSLILKFWRLISEISRMTPENFEVNNYHYISTAFFYALRAYYKKHDTHEIQGLIYPGAMTEAKGLNIVLTPNTVDENLILKEVCMFKLSLNKNNYKSYNLFPCSEFLKVANKTFSFKEYNPNLVV